MNAMPGKHLFNLIGISIVILWLFLVGLLIKKASFNNSVKQIEFVAEKIPERRFHQRDWMEVYLKGRKVGYSVSQVSPLGDNYLIQDEIFLRLNLMGQATGMRAVTRSIVDHAFFLKSFRFTMISGIVTFQASGKVEADEMLLEIGEGNARRSKRIKLSGPPVTGSGMTQIFRGQPIEVGRSFMFPFFDPSTASQKAIAIKVVAKETIVIAGIKYDTFRLETAMWGQPMTFWLDENGIVLKEEGFMGLTLVKSSAAKASRGIEASGGKDFYDLCAIDVQGKLTHADRLSYLKLEVEGLDETHFDTAILDSGRQRFQGGVIEIVQERLPLRSTYALPYREQSGEMRAFLDPELNVESDQGFIKEKVHEIVGDAKDPVAVARRLMAWVYANVEKRPVISVPSALEVLKSKVGDCNEHAVLLTAFLRAAGIPARLCVGIVYTRERFFYHAWTESWLGDWVSMDATLNQMPVDATHIKLVEGGLDKQVEIISLIGKIRLKVNDYRY